ncbi:hypothetical protein N665_0121s0018 [Sinapis alba]|nr:hypothetical protein N665_0121s0018 [Sinapis alba]
MIYTGSSVYVLFYDTFRRMEFNKSELKVGSFSKDIRQLVDFFVVDKQEPFNATLDKQWIYAMKAISSTYHQCVNFPSLNGLQTICGSQKLSGKCYMGC